MLAVLVIEPQEGARRPLAPVKIRRAAEKSPFRAIAVRHRRGPHPECGYDIAHGLLASLLPSRWNMTTGHLKPTAVHTPTPMVRWVFHRDGFAITCEVDARDTKSYDVTFTPHWDPSGAVIERFNRPLRALERHMSIARRLRDDGWVLVDHAIPDYVRTAA